MRRFRIAVGARGAHTAGVVDVLTREGWEETGGLDWNLYWGLEPPDEALFRACGGARRLNSLWGAGALAVKSALHRQLARARQRLAIIGRADLVDIEPRTFVMPDDYAAWRDAAEWEPDTWWIRKPEASSRGRGITLVDALAEVTPESGWVVQEYLKTPHLLDGHKYTLRLYVLITSVDPCVAFLHADGFAKLASRPFRSDREGRRDRFAHLTNPDVLREDTSAPVSSRNLTLDAYRRRLTDAGVDVDRLWQRIRRVAAAAVLCAREPMRLDAEAHAVTTSGCFELLGLDVTLDERLRPLLLECNVGPSLAVEADPATGASRDEAGVKRRVITDTLRTIGAIGEGAPTRFAPLVPSADTVDLLPCLDALRDGDVAGIRERIRRDGGWQALTPYGATHERMGDQLMLYVSQTEEFLPLNAGASVMWLGLAGGLSPDAIADEMRPALTDADAGAAGVADAVWLAMCNWLWTGLLAPAGPAHSSPVRTHQTRLIEWHDDPVIEVFGWRGAVRGPRSVVEAIRPALLGLEVTHPVGELDGAIEILPSDGEFVVTTTGRETRCGALALAATLVREATRAACVARGAVMAAHAAVDRSPGGASIAVHAHERAREPVLVCVAADGALELLTPAGERMPLRQVVLEGGAEGEAERVAPDVGFLEWLAADRRCVLALDEVSSVQFMRAANGLRFVRALMTTTAHASPGTR